MKILSHGCTLDCADCCKFNVYIDNNTIVKVEGDKNHPYTKGFICNKGRAHLTRLNHNKRIYTPLLKKNGVWKEISFNEAIKIMANKIVKYNTEYSAKSIMYYEQYGNGSLLKSIGEIFCNFLGGVTMSKGGPCWSAGIAAQKLDFGDSKSHSLEDMLNSKSIIIWGKNPANTSIHTMQMINRARSLGVKIIVIDPIKTMTAEVADIFVNIKPNGDLALALAMSKLIIEKGYVDTEYINKYVDGFDEYKKLISTLNINDLVEECGVDLSTISKIIELYCTKYSTILLGYGLQKYKNGGNTIRAIDALGAITGQIGFSGGGINYANKVYPSILNLDPFFSDDLCDNRYFYVSDIANFIKKCNSENCEIPIKMAIVTKSNMLNQLPNLNSLIESFKTIEFKVCFDMFLTDTAKECDLFIPTTSSFESEDLLFSSMTNPYLIYNEKLVEPKNELMDEYYFYRELAQKMNLDNYPKCTKNDYLKEVLKPLNKYIDDFNIEKLKNSYLTIHKDVSWSDKIFETKTGKINLGVNYLMYIKRKNNKLRLITNHSKNTLSSQHMMDNNNIAIAFINKSTAKGMNIKDGEIVKLKSVNGEIKVKVAISESISEDVIMMYVGWWAKSGNPNFLTVSEISDFGGQIAYNETFVEIIKEQH